MNPNTPSLLPWFAMVALCACKHQPEAALNEPKPAAAAYSNPFGTAVLREGAKGPEVAALQQALNAHLAPSPGLAVNGQFGPQTREAVRQFQAQNDLSVDGFVGPGTMLALGADLDPYFQESSRITSETGPRVITRNVLQDSRGGFWLATWQGILRFDGQHFTNVTNQAGLRRYRAFCLLEDRAQNIWIGTCGAGIYRFDGSTYTNFTELDGLIDDTVLSIFQDKEGNLWFGGMGVTKFDGETFSPFGEEAGFTNSDVHSIAQAPDGSLWFGTRGALFRFADGTFTDFTAEHGVDIETNSYTPGWIDRHGHLWFSGSKGIFHYDGESLRHLYELPSFAFFEDSRGHLWFNGGGLEDDQPKPNKTVLHRFDPADGLENLGTAGQRFEIENGMVFGFEEDRDGQIWFGTGSGLVRIAGDTVTYF